jgi:M6 family metalloprotease-like protein
MGWIGIPVFFSSQPFSYKEVTMNTIKRSTLSSIVVVLSLSLGLLLCPTFAQDPAEVTTKTGLLTIIWGNEIGGKTSVIYTLTNAMGQRTRLQISDEVSKKLGGILQYNGKQVTVRGTWVAKPDLSGAPVDPEAQPEEIFNVDIIKLTVPSEPSAPTPEGAPGPEGVAGSHPWVTIMCKCSDIADEPEDYAFFEDMYSDTKPGLDHYWQEVSFSTFDVNGSIVAGTDWYTLPHDDAHYNPTGTSGGADLTALMNDCIAEADPDVDFSLYDGINMMFNWNFDRGWAWGGGTGTITLDGVTKSWSVTWEPPWAYADISVIAHEMGHGFGLPHSTAIDWTSTYDNAWDVMSQDRYNCGAGSVHRDATYGCMAQHTISHHKDLLEVIPAAKIMTVIPGTSVTINLDDLAAPPSTGYHMVKIPIGTSAESFYTVETRQHTGYDAKLPGEAVIIHEVETYTAVLVPSASATDPAVMWNVGETFTDAANGIEVTVNSTTVSGFEVTVSNRPISNPIDMVLALDRSGSMLWSVPGDNPEGYATRRDALSAGVDRFLANVLALSPPVNSTLGLTLFSSKALDVPTFTALRTPVDAALAVEVANEIGPAAPVHSAAPGCDWMTTPENCEWGSTSIGAALQAALAKLSSGTGTHLKTIVLFTDGEQNTAPYVTTDGLKICAASSDPAACAAEPEIDPDVRIISVGIGDPSSSYHTLLQNVANESQFGTYISANTTTPDDFPCAGSITDAFQCVACYTLAGNSPQMVSYSSGILGNTPKALDTFEVNAGVRMLLLSISFDQDIAPSSIENLSSWIVIKKDQTDVTRHFSIVDATDTSKHVLVKAVFRQAGETNVRPFLPQGRYNVTLTKPSGISGELEYSVISVVDDHSLNMTWEVSEPNYPRADEAFLPSMRLIWLGMPLDDATVTARVLRPGDDLGDVLAKMPDVDLQLKAKGREMASAGQLKYLSLLKNSELVQKILPTSGQHALQYRGSGTYDTPYNPNQVSGVYQIRYNVFADMGIYGKVQRVVVQSVYVQPGDIDVEASIISKTLQGNTLTVKVRPKTTYGKLIGPGQMRAFNISGQDIERVDIKELGQDGTYQIVLSGDLDKIINVNYLGNPLFNGPASDFGDKPEKPFLKWLFILLLIALILLVLWLLWRKFKSRV